MLVVGSGSELRGLETDCLNLSERGNDNIYQHLHFNIPKS